MKIGNIDIKVHDEAVIIFFLHEKSKNSHSEIININNELWMVSVEDNNYAIILRNKNYNSSTSQCISSAYQAAQMFLDKLVFVKTQLSYIDHKESVIVFHDSKKEKNAVIQSTIQMQMKGKIEYHITDMKGNVQHVKERVVKHSIPFRYYRMALNCNNLMDAYKYLYIAIEAALNSYKVKKISEKKWLEETFNSFQDEYNVTTKYDVLLSEHFIEEQYKKIRVKLFHSKHNYILPFEDYDSSKLYNAYLDLSYITDIVFESLFSIKLMSGTTIDNTAVNLMLKNIRISNLTFKNKLEKKYKLNESDVIFKLNELSGKYSIDLYSIEGLIFNQIDHLNNMNSVLFSNKLKEVIQLDCLNKLSIELSVIFLNKTPYDRNFFDNFVIVN